MRRVFYLSLALALACTNVRLYYAHNELPKLEGRDDLAVGPGPWPSVPPVVADSDSIPDELVLSTLKALMALPGAADSCDLETQPFPNAAEYCVALYRTPRDWRVSWPVRKLVKEQTSCQPPFGGVDDADYGRHVFVFGYAHNHPCGIFASSSDLTNFPATKSPEGIWVMVAYGTAPNGELARDPQGQPIPAWGWLATGHLKEPRFYKWNAAGEMYKWDEGRRQWRFQATCQPQSRSLIGGNKVLPPKCVPEFTKWFL